MATTGPRRDTEPVRKAGVVAGAVAGLIITAGGLARGFGWLSDDYDVATVARQVSDLILGAGVLWATVAPLVLALWARGKVTPLTDPRDDAGNPLVVEGELAGDDVDQAPGQVPDEQPAAAAVGPAVDPLPTTEMPVVPAVPAAAEATPIADAVAAALIDDTMPAMAAVRG